MLQRLRAQPIRLSGVDSTPELVELCHPDSDGTYGTRYVERLRFLDTISSGLTGRRCGVRDCRTLTVLPCAKRPIKRGGELSAQYCGALLSTTGVV